jgi:hypothetical protein
MDALCLLGFLHLFSLPELGKVDGQQLYELAMVVSS